MSIGYHAIAAPIRDATDQTVAAIGIIVHGTDVSRDKLLGDILPLLTDTAAAVSADFAHMSHLPRSRTKPVEPGYVNFSSTSTPA